MVSQTVNLMRKALTERYVDREALRRRLEVKLNGCSVTCMRCDGIGVIGALTPDECPTCGGSGHNWRYRSGVLARYYGGPLLGKDTAR